MAKKQGPWKVAMCLMAHPDDCEFMAAGTLALLAQKGWEIHIVSSTPGDAGSMELGPIDIARVRTGENARAAELIGATYHCLGLQDLHVTFDRDAINRVCRLTRHIAPTLMITHCLQDYMPDHEVTAQLARTASIGYFVPNVCTGPIKPGSGMPHLYYADPVGVVDYYGNRAPAGIRVNISSVIATKEKMLKAHASQRNWLRAHYGVDEYTRMMKEGSAIRGQEIGVEYAEGFRQHKGAGYPQDCLLSRELGELVVRND